MNWRVPWLVLVPTGTNPILNVLHGSSIDATTPSPTYSCCFNFCIYIHHDAESERPRRCLRRLFEILVAASLQLHFVLSSSASLLQHLLNTTRRS